MLQLNAEEQERYDRLVRAKTDKATSCRKPPDAANLTNQELDAIMGDQHGASWRYRSVRIFRNR